MFNDLLKDIKERFCSKTNKKIDKKKQFKSNYKMCKIIVNGGRCKNKKCCYFHTIEQLDIHNLIYREQFINLYQIRVYKGFKPPYVKQEKYLKIDLC